ncbi:MAG TPA: tRNA pseudouridine(38-40) synthase TruA [Candidatus Kapabacteria bacterium]|nr:tRNA pseudouridine(38-40) synthase TruA [Candidatus Kapabacteria bacterium]
MKLALLAEYDGTEFSGWQVQPNQRTVQGEIETAVQRLTGQIVTVIGSGRTDAGVHAKAMVAHTEVDLNDSLPLWKVIEALNALTGEDIVIKDVREVSSDFHSRFSAHERTYRYQISRSRIALERNYFWQVPYELDIEAMQHTFAALLGEHDFTSFSKLSDDVDHYRCIITNTEMIESEETITMWLSANRFVRGMVRALVGGIVEVGRGRLGQDEYARLLNDPQELDRARFICPAQGLTFWKVIYPEKFGLWN